MVYYIAMNKPKSKKYLEILTVLKTLCCLYFRLIHIYDISRKWLPPSSPSAILIAYNNKMIQNLTQKLYFGLYLKQTINMELNY